MGSEPGIRRARAADQFSIAGLVLRHQLNPFDLYWKRFVVATDAGDEVVGCGQIRRHGEISELASLVVDARWQGRGVSKLLIEALIREVEGPLWLMCESQLCDYYRKFGFREVKTDAELPTYFRFQSRFVTGPINLFLQGRGTYVAFMTRDGDEASGLT